ncbi:unnamed protein product [Ilex paraguariensis]|uniref:DUF4283 domain-containing protein n=1 Tax=Ilex paraguariensis TaxID=185542 RepID=A0ABC8SET5_9AQUA
MTGEALTSKDPKKINGAPTCSTNYQAINESGSLQSLTKTSLGSEQKDTPPNPPSLPNKVIANKTPCATSTTVDVEIEDHHNIQEFPTLPTGNSVRDSSPVPTVNAIEKLVESFDLLMNIRGKIETIEVKVEYQWRPKICHNCCIFGHTESTCPKQRTVESWKPKPAPLQASSDRLDNGKAIATMTGLEQQEAGQTQVEELIGGYQASSLVTVKNNMGMVIQGGASTSSQQEILGHDHHITKITVNESTPPQLLMQAGVTLASNKFEELNKEGANCG